MTEFSYTGAQQTYEVPAGVTEVEIECEGAQGGTVIGAGGLGGRASGKLAVTPFETLYVNVGGSPSGVPAGGGGASDVRQGGNALTDRKIVAGGGGGAGRASATPAAGGDGGGTSGGLGGSTDATPTRGGGGGTQSAGGVAGGAGSGSATAGTLGAGGNGAAAVAATGGFNGGGLGGGTFDTRQAGGGGGGYYGGGGGSTITSPNFQAGGGGGGSGYIGGVTDGSMSTGVRSGHGRVVITPVEAEADVALDANLPAITGTFTLDAELDVALAADLPPIVGAVSLDVEVDAALVADLPPITGAFDFEAVPDTPEVALDADLPAITGGFTIDAEQDVVLAADLPPITGTFTLTSEIDTALVADLPPITGAFDLSLDGATHLSLNATLPPIGGAFDLEPGAVTFVTLGNGLGTGSVAYAEWEPPVIEPPAFPLVVHSKVKTRAYTSVAVTDAAPPALTAPLVATADRARTRIVVAGRDITYWRGMPTPEPTYSLMSPLGYGSGSLELPQTHAAFEAPGRGHLSWLKPWAPIKVQRVLDGAVVATDYRGFLFDPQMDGRSWTFGLVGEATGPASNDYRPPRIFRRQNDLGHWWNQLLRKLKVKRGPLVDTGVKIQNRGDMDLLVYAQELSGQGVTRTGGQWTVMPTANGTYRLARKDTTTVHGTVYFDDEAVTGDLRRDPAEEWNTVYATAINPNGRRVRFVDAPGFQLRQPPPPFPGFMEQGDTGDGVLTVVTRLWQVGYLSFEDRPGGYDADVTQAVRDLQDDAELPITGNVNKATWDAMFDFGATGYNIAGTQIMPAAQKRALRKYRRSPSGVILGKNPHYKPSAKVTAKAIDVGPGFTSKQTRNFAKGEIHEGDSPNWTGIIRFELGGVIAGTHTPGDPIAGLVTDARALRVGMNLWAPLFDGGTLLHIGGIDVTRGAGGRSVVTCSVDTRARDTMAVWEVIDRNRESRRSPNRQWLREFRSSILNKDGVIESDSFGGLTPPVDLESGRWNVFPVPMGQSGTVGRLRVIMDEPTEYVLAVFGRKVGRGLLAGTIGNPLTQAGSERWTDDVVLNGLRRRQILLGTWGDHENPCGYPNRLKSEGGALKRFWDDFSGFEYRTFDDYSLWVAVYPATDCTVEEGRILFNRQESGS